MASSSAIESCEMTSRSHRQTVRNILLGLMTAYRVLAKFIKPGRGESYYSIRMSRFFWLKTIRLRWHSFRLTLICVTTTFVNGVKWAYFGLWWLWLVEGNECDRNCPPLVRVITISQGHSRSNELEMRGHARKVSMIDKSGQSVILQIEETTLDMITCKYDLKDTLHWVGDSNRTRELVTHTCRGQVGDCWNMCPPTIMRSQLSIMMITCLNLILRIHVGCNILQSTGPHISVMIGWLEFDITVVRRWWSVDPLRSYL